MPNFNAPERFSCRRFPRAGVFQPSPSDPSGRRADARVVLQKEREGETNRRRRRRKSVSQANNISAMEKKSKMKLREVEHLRYCVIHCRVVHPTYPYIIVILQIGRRLHTLLQTELFSSHLLNSVFQMFNFIDSCFRKCIFTSEQSSFFTYGDILDRKTDMLVYKCAFTIENTHFDLKVKYELF